jgi:tetratricopeptide (TPR) repeat protein
MRTAVRALATLGCLAFVLPALAPAADTPAASPAATPALGDMSKVGNVHFPTSCDPAVQKDFERGVALLHSFFYEEARRVFTQVAEQDPNCAMAWWGVAMTYYHPLWTAPDSTELQAGRAAAERALAASETSDREREYVQAIAAFYSGIDSPIEETTAGAPSCHGPAMMDPRGRAACYGREMAKLAGDQPNDTEAAAFYALSLLGTATPGDPALVNQKKAAQILEPLFAKMPDHPGLAHYLIHSYDYPPLARQGLRAANTYAALAPWVPHALHMPSHIYTRLGMWQETIDANRASADAARKYEAAYHPGAASFEELHALDYLTYAYLQVGADQKAAEVLARVQSIKKTHPESDFTVSYAFGAIPARYALERRMWKEAAALTVPDMPFMRQYPFAEGHIVYARGVGAARGGDGPAAIQAADRLKELAASIKDPRFRYFQQQMLIQKDALIGLAALAGGFRDQAIVVLRATAGKEDSLGKHPVSPGAILPIREILADALLGGGKPEDALVEYQAALKLYPRRFNGTYGAAVAAERSGKKDEARRYYNELLEIAKAGDGTRYEIGQARAALKRL